MQKSFKNFLLMFWTWLKIGLFTFGGGYAMIALIQNEVSQKRKWLTDEELTTVIAVAESTPGPIAINSATYIGYKTLGFWGSFFATIGVVLPSFVVIFLISLFFDDLLQYEIVANAFKGIKAGVASLIVLAGLKLFKSAKKDVWFIILFCLALLATLSISIFSLNFSTLYLIIIGAVVGLFLTILSNQKPNKTIKPDNKDINNTNTKNTVGSNDANALDKNDTNSDKKTGGNA